MYLDLGGQDKKQDPCGIDETLYTTIRYINGYDVRRASPTDSQRVITANGRSARAKQGR